MSPKRVASGRLVTAPTLVTPIGGQNAVENSPFSLNVTTNFTDPDNPTLSYSAIGLPASGNLALDPATGILSGTPLEADAQDFARAALDLVPLRPSDRLDRPQEVEILEVGRHVPGDAR